MNLWKFLFGEDKREPRLKKANASSTAKKDVSAPLQPKRKLEIKPETQRLRFAKKGEQPKPPRSSSTAADIPSKKNVPAPPGQTTTPTRKTPPKPPTQPSITPEELILYGRIEKRMKEVIREIEDLVFYHLSGVLIFDKKRQRVVANYVREDLDLKKLRPIIAQLFDLLEHSSGLRVRELAIFHFGHYCLGISFNDDFAIFVMMDAEKINKGIALSIIRPRILKLLDEITMWKNNLKTK